jgi:hypothetical protein
VNPNRRRTRVRDHSTLLRVFSSRRGQAAHQTPIAAYTYQE